MVLVVKRQFNGVLKDSFEENLFVIADPASIPRIGEHIKYQNAFYLVKSVHYDFYSNEIEIFIS